MSETKTAPKKRLRIVLNAPVTLAFCGLCLITLLLSLLTQGASNRLLFSVYGSSLLDPLTYVRLFGHVLGHSGWNHFFQNMLFILLLGPMLEEKYGSFRLAVMMAITAFVTGLLLMAFSGNTLTMGASGIVFFMILLASFTSTQEGTLPVTVLLVAAAYLGQQVVQAFAGSAPNVSYLAHISGGALGGALGYVLNKKKKK